MGFRKNGKNFWRSTILFCVLFFGVFIVMINNRVTRLEKVIDEREKIVARFLDLEVRVLELERQALQIQTHHEELLELVNKQNDETTTDE